MKTILFFISVIGLVGCNTYTVKNDTEESIKAGDETIEAGDCAEYSDSFFGLFGDYPISITKEDDSDLSEDAEEEYKAAHYVVQTDGSVVSVKEACEEEDADAEGDKTAAPAEGETAAPAEGETAAPAEGETAAPAEGETAAPAEGETAAPVEGETAAPAEGETAAPAGS